MKITLSVIKADVGSIGGHTRPSVRMVQTIKDILDGEVGKLLIDSYVDFTGDDIKLVMTHKHGEGARNVHKLAWGAFKAATAVAQEYQRWKSGAPSPDSGESLPDYSRITQAETMAQVLDKVTEGRA